MFKTGLQIPTFCASVVLGRKVGYTEELLSFIEVKQAIVAAAASVEGFTFSGTLTETVIYAVGPWGTYQEPAILIQSSIYPRFPVERDKFKEGFTSFVVHLATDLHQERAAVQFSDESFMLETEHCKEPDLQ